MNSATQSAPPWPLTPIPRHNPRILAPNASPNRAEEVSYDIKPDIGEGNVYIQDTWPELSLVKFEPAVELDPRQAPDETSDNDWLEKKFVAKIAGCRLASILIQSFHPHPHSRWSRSTYRQRIWVPQRPRNIADALKGRRTDVAIP